MNEDWCGVSAGPGVEEFILVVADGVTNEKRSDRASKIAVDTVLKSYSDKRRDTSIDVAMYQAFRDADRALSIVAEQLADQLESGLYTTLSAVVYDAGLLYIAYLGDSPISVLDENGAVAWSARPHSDPGSGGLYRYLGGPEVMEPTTQKVKFPDGGLLILASDGLSAGSATMARSARWTDEVWRVATSARSLEAASRELTERSRACQDDDVTVLLGCVWPLEQRMRPSHAVSDVERGPRT